MNTTNGNINEFKPLKYNDKTNKYIVSWGLKNIGGDNYEWKRVNVHRWYTIAS